MADTLLSIGKNFFYSPKPGEETPNYQALTRDLNWTWTAQPRLSRENANQFTGIGEKRAIVEGRLYPHIFGGLKTLDAIEATGDEGKPVPLIRYFRFTNPVEYIGELVGLYGIARLRRQETKINSGNVPMAVDFTLELIQFGEDSASTSPDEFLRLG
jgi:phage protein U